MQVRPSRLGTTYVELEYEALAGEQAMAWAAEGEEVARAHQLRAQGLARRAATTEVLLAEQELAVREANAAYLHAARVLLPYTRREPGAKWRYALCWPLLVLGDMSGVWAAAVSFGEVPAIALGQALASGVAAGCAGLVGSEVKALRLARGRARDPETLSDDERRYQRLFVGRDRGARLVGLAGLLSLVVMALLSVGIFILRASTEGTAAGAMFGCLAAATAMGSFLLGYASADEVADLLYAYQRRARSAERHFRRLGSASVLRRQAEAAEAARSLGVEHQARGLAATQRVEALAWRIQHNNAVVTGHGFAAGEAGGVIGRRRRQDGAQ
ncbi:hypothetical protein DFJ69_0087 [Thermomonospora umbrina]|uniref:Uncharacterized protein n=1 Tax=Thermomonospora umbrina TaxID=111806 RepID=A0A3D9SGC6_9ACTN|nr:hypothetical protein DFJ69_0087 [Thermomonospora umbrina]